MPAEIIYGDIRNLDPKEFRSVLQSHGIRRIDTAARYFNGESERKIGRENLSKSFVVDTKIETSESGDHTLTANAVEKSLTNSLTALGVDRVHILYCHQPDNKTPIAEQAKTMDEQYKKGRFQFLGVSNFSAAMLQEWLDVAEEKGYVKPAVFQGQYNLLCRSYEDALFPLLHKHNMRFGAFSPLAGGFLLGNFTAEGVQGGSRFASDQSPYKQWYDRPSMHEAVRRLREIAARTGVDMDELSLRWLRYHSGLRDDDWMIMGASNISQVAHGCEKAQRGALDTTVAQELSDLWQGVKAAGAEFIPS